MMCKYIRFHSIKSCLKSKSELFLLQISVGYVFLACIGCCILWMFSSLLYERRLGTLRESMCLSTRIESILVEEMEVFVIY